MSCGTLLRTRVRFSPPPPAGRSRIFPAASLRYLAGRERKGVQDLLERRVGGAARRLFDLEGVSLALEHDDHTAIGRTGIDDQNPVSFDARHRGWGHRVASSETGLGLVLGACHQPDLDWRSTQ